MPKIGLYVVARRKRSGSVSQCNISEQVVGDPEVNSWHAGEGLGRVLSVARRCDCAVLAEKWPATRVKDTEPSMMSSYSEPRLRLDYSDTENSYDSVKHDEHGSEPEQHFHQIRPLCRRKAGGDDNKPHSMTPIKKRQLQHIMADRGQHILSAKKEQKRRPKPRDGTQLICGVCNDRALGYNFDAITCESCKAFFRRNANKSKSFTCSFDGNCKLDPHTRKFCSGCRLKKCFTIGMKKDWILSNEQLAKRRSRIRERSATVSSSVSEQDCVESPSSSGDISSSSCLDECPSTDYSVIDYPEFQLSESPEPVSVKEEPVDIDYEDSMIPLREDINHGIRTLEVSYNEIFEATYTPEQIRNLQENPNNKNDLFNMTDIFIRRLIKFSKCIPEFKALKQEEQIHLLKGGIMEMFIFRSAMSFDMQRGSWKFKAQMEEGRVQEKGLKSQVLQNLDSNMFCNHIDFISSLHKLCSGDRVVLMLLSIIDLMAEDRPNLHSTELIAQAKQKFCYWLRAYLESTHTVRQVRFLFPELLQKLSDVRNLGEASSKMAATLDIHRLEPLLVEVFDLR